MTTRRPRLRTILFAVNVVILLLPLGGIAVLRLYESALVRQTESELIGQAAILAAAYRAAFERERGVVTSSPHAAKQWRPRAANLDLAIDTVRPPAPAALPAAAPPNAAAVAAGNELLRVMRDAQVVTLAAIRVFDAAGTVVASTGEDLGRSIAHYEEVERVLRGEIVSLLRERISDEPEPPLASISRGTDVRVFVAMPAFDGLAAVGGVLLSRTPRSIGQTLLGKRAEIGAGIAALSALVIALTVFTAFTIDRPLARLLRQARRATKGERGAVVPLPHPVTAEVAELSEGFAAMARALEEREEYLRGFASQASHELKTPLAGLRGGLELLQDHAESMSADERGRFLANLTGDVDRLEKLVRRLLDLARVDVMRPGERICDAAEVIGRLAARGRAEGLDVVVEPVSDAYPVAIAEEELEVAIGSLLDNARQHAGAHATVAIEIRRGSDGVAEILVADDGAGIATADRDRVFEPFFTTARAAGGTGLGLTILRAVLKAHGGSVELLASEAGARFRLRLPLVPLRPWVSLR